MYYAEYNNNIIAYHNTINELNQVLAMLPQYQGAEIREVPNGYTISYDYRLVTIEEFEQEQAQKERERLDALSLTPSDVERALYKAKQMDFEDLKALIAEQAPQIDMKALSIEFRANNFYRGVVVNGMRLIDTVGALLGYTPADMDYLFEHKELPVVDIINGSNGGGEAS